MKLETAKFGLIEINENNIITFYSGLPGFEHLNRFIFIHESNDQPYAYMQSIDDGNISFIVVNPFAFVSDYEFDINEIVQAELEISSLEDVFVWVLLTAIGSLETATINLLAPIVVNFNSRLAKQVILNDSSYMTKHPLFTNGG